MFRDRLLINTNGLTEEERRAIASRVDEFNKRFRPGTSMDASAFLSGLESLAEGLEPVLAAARTQALVDNVRNGERPRRGRPRRST